MFFFVVAAMAYSFTVLVGGSRARVGRKTTPRGRVFEQPYFRLVSSHTPMNKTTKRVYAIRLYLLWFR